jgi:NAD(P)-dependent dehydrogenase (short-subunit alcohol dehydrogenase family)
LLRELEDFFPGIRQTIAGRQLLEYLRPKALLQLRYASQHGRVIHVDALSGGSNRAVARDCKKVANVIPIDHRANHWNAFTRTEIGQGSIALQLNVADRVSIAAVAERIGKEFGRLDLLVNNGAISNTRMQQLDLSLQDYAKISLASNASLDEMRAVWETHVFGVLAVYQAMLPLLRVSSNACIVNVSSGVGSLTTNADANFPCRAFYVPIYPASKTALNPITLAMMIELESTGIKVNLVSPPSPRRTSTDTTARSPSRWAPGRWSASLCLAPTALQAR